MNKRPSWDTLCIPIINIIHKVYKTLLKRYIYKNIYGYKQTFEKVPLLNYETFMNPKHMNKVPWNTNFHLYHVQTNGHKVMRIKAIRSLGPIKYGLTHKSYISWYNQLKIALFGHFLSTSLPKENMASTSFHPIV